MEKVDQMPANVIIGKGDLLGKGVYANKNFKKGEIVIRYHLKQLTEEEYENLPEEEKNFTHIQKGIIYLYSAPERYVNHSGDPNVHADFVNQCDIAIRDITKGEMITCDSSKDDF